MKTLYIMLTRNQTLFCKLITLYTHQPFAHVSLLFDNDFKYGFSFSRKNINNPFIGGFKKEDYPEWVKKFPSTSCRVYTLTVNDEVYDQLYDDVQRLYEQKDLYTYNILGVIGRCFKLRIEPKNSYFCSQFVSYLLTTHNILSFDKDPICTTAGDFIDHPSLTLLYEGSLAHLVNAPTVLVPTAIKQIS